MAISFTKISASSNRLVYKLVGDGSARSSTVSKTNAQLLADCVAGPLKDLIAATYADSAAVQAVFGGGAVQVSSNLQVASSTAIATVAPIFNASSNLPVLAFSDAAAPAASDATFVVIEHKHSLVE